MLPPSDLNPIRTPPPDKLPSKHRPQLDSRRERPTIWALQLGLQHLWVHLRALAQQPLHAPLVRRPFRKIQPTLPPVHVVEASFNARAHRHILPLVERREKARVLDAEAPALARVLSYEFTNVSDCSAQPTSTMAQDGLARGTLTYFVEAQRLVPFYGRPEHLFGVPTLVTFWEGAGLCNCQTHTVIQTTISKLRVVIRSLYLMERIGSLTAIDRAASII
jgi:hypothetical protein